MDGRTYKFFKGKPMYPFGYGLSYGEIEYYNIRLSSEQIAIGEDIEVSVRCINRGEMDVKEAVQVYLSDDDASTRVPIWKLVDFIKIDLPSGEEKVVSFKIKAKDMAVITDNGEYKIEPGTFTLHVGGSQPDMRSSCLMGYDPLSAKFLVK
jgi:beta-glucosidase